MSREKPIADTATTHVTVSIFLNPDCAVGIYCGLKIHAIPPRRDFTVLVLDILMNMPAGQNRSNCAFRNGFLRLATMPTAQSGLKGKEWVWGIFRPVR